VPACTVETAKKIRKKATQGFCLFIAVEMHPSMKRLPRSRFGDLGFKHSHVCDADPGRARL
jgi:hypothetical protein